MELTMCDPSKLYPGMKLLDRSGEEWTAALSCTDTWLLFPPHEDGRFALPYEVANARRGPMRPAPEKCGTEYVISDDETFTCTRNRYGWFPDIHRDSDRGWFFRPPIIGGTYYIPPRRKKARS